jgi:AcrR family transcriptional regulator
MTASAKPAPRRAELLEVAISLFYEKGYAHTTLQDIADRMGFTKAAIYYYAKNKEELLVEIYEAIVEPAIADARALAAEPFPDGATAFVALIEQHLRTFLSNVEANAVFEVQNFSLSEPAKRRIQSLARTYDNLLREVYERGIADGSIAPGNSTVAVNAIIGMCNSAHRWYRPRGKYSVNQVIAELMSFVDAGIRPPSADGED